MSNYDIIIIGAGPAGYSAAIRSAQLGATTLLVENGKPGGTCLNRGCIPTKFLWESLHLAGKLKKAPRFGIEADYRGIAYPQLQKQKEQTVELLAKGLSRLFESYSIETLEGKARFSGSRRVTIDTASGRISAEGKKIIIAAGSRPSEVPGLSIDHARIIDSTDALSLAAVPASLLVVGGGAIGVEMATIFAGLGSEVHLIEREEQLLPREDAELAAEVKKALERHGIKVTLGPVSLEELAGKYEKALVAAGRRPNSDTLDLEKAGVTFSPKGIPVDESFATSSPGVYACGDVTGTSYLAYVAQAQGIAAAENALGHADAAPDIGAVPRVVFSMPAAASVGASENDIPETQVAVGRFPLAANTRAFIEGERTGWAKIVADKASNKILGAQIIGPHAEELIAIISLAVRHNLTVADLRRELFFHPSIGEAIHAACEDALGRSVDLPKRR